MRKRLILVFTIFFIGTVFYITTQGASNVVSFVDGAKNLQTITVATDAITKNWADTLVMGSLEKNVGGCRIKLGSFYAEESTLVHFWQGSSWGLATTTVTTTAANSCVCPTGTTKILRRSQSNNGIDTLDTTWWKDVYYRSSYPYIMVGGWTTECTVYSQNYPAGCLWGDSGCTCSYRLNNWRDMLDNGYGPGCAGWQTMFYAEYLYNCVANSEILKQ